MFLVRICRREGFTLVEIMTVICILCILAAIAIFNYSTPRKQAYDIVAQEDLRRAFASAITYFTDHPNGVLTHSSLKQYGFRPSPKVSLSIIDGRSSHLLLISRYNALGTQAYITYSKDMDSSGPSLQFWVTPIQSLDLGGRPPIVTPGLWIPGESGSGQEAASGGAALLEKCNLVAKMDLGEAYAAAQAFFQSNHKEPLTMGQLATFGYTPSENVSLTIIDGSFSAFSLSAVFNVPGATSFILDPSGKIAPSA